MKNIKLNRMVKISLLSVMAFLLMFIDVPLPIFPAFLKIDISDLPALLGAFAMGPIAGVAIELFKNILILILKGTSSGFVGEFANFTVGAIFVLVSGYIYKLNKTKKMAIISLFAGVLAFSIGATVLNYFVFLPLYSVAFKMPVEAFIGMGAAVNSNIDSLLDFVLLSILPFNLLKGVVVAAITIPVYKSVSGYLQSEELTADQKKTAYR
ncbi:ECF transporter S component [Clostridium sediminicola]|uniref:ECF transporter S component n=1 Tax=Clostridium sediminicola TaxID=3114879 RepID=UPI0031F1C68F